MRLQGPEFPSLIEEESSRSASACRIRQRFKVEQAGDRFVLFVLDEIEKARSKLPAIAAAADRAAERIVDQVIEGVGYGDGTDAVHAEDMSVESLGDGRYRIY